MSQTIKVRADSWIPQSMEEVKKLMDKGWVVVDVETDKHESCHEPTISSDETVYYILEERPADKNQPG